MTETSPRPAANGDEAVLRAFAAVLHLEQHALVHGEVETLDTLAREKMAYAERLASAAWTAERVARCRALIGEVRALNEQNGRLVAWRAGRLAERLAALGALAPEGTTYDAGGYARSRFVSPRIATASGSRPANSAPHRPATG